MSQPEVILEYAKDGQPHSAKCSQCGYLITAGRAPEKFYQRVMQEHFGQHEPGAPLLAQWTKTGDTK